MLHVIRVVKLTHKNEENDGEHRRGFYQLK